MTRTHRHATSAALVTVLMAGSGLATAGDPTRVIIGIDSGNLGVGLTYRDGGYRPHLRYDERYRYYAPPPSYAYDRGYRDGYRDGRRTQHRHGPGRADRARGRWERSDHRWGPRYGW
jgi:hypothetical protein